MHRSPGVTAAFAGDRRAELTQLHERVGTTTIYVTHDQVEAMAMGDRIVVLHDGIVRQIGTPREVYDEPADTFVATFLGSPPMNLLEAPQVTIGFRPESLVPAGAVRGDALPVRFRVTLAEYLGSERILHGAVEGGRFDGRKVVSRLPAATSGEIAQGTSYPFAVPRSEVRQFEPGNGRRIAGRQIPWP
jgi:multiple sugar transport system ATP-binding protein